MKLAGGVENAIRIDRGIAKGVNVSGEKIRYKAVAEDLKLRRYYEALKS